MRKKLIFDLDGTLVNSIPDIAEGMNIFLKRNGFPLIEETNVKLTIGKGARISLEKLLDMQKISVSTKQFDLLYQEYIAIYQKKNILKTHLWPNVKQTLSILQKNGYQMAICTNKPIIPTERILTKLKIKNFFQTIANPDTSGVTKPNPKIMYDCLEGLKASAQECIMIGDSETDVDAAKALNIPIILLSYGYALKPYETLNADKITDNFAKIPETLNALNQNSEK